MEKIIYIAQAIWPAFICLLAALGFAWIGYAGSGQPATILCILFSILSMLCVVELITLVKEAIQEYNNTDK